MKDIDLVVEGVDPGVMSSAVPVALSMSKRDQQ